MIREYEITVLQAPRSTTDAGVTGGWTDMQGYLMGNREVKLILLAGVGTTAGAVQTVIFQSAEDTAGTGAATLKAFTGLTSAGGMEVQHAVIPAAHRYVRFLGDLETGKDMIIAGLVQSIARVSP